MPSEGGSGEGSTGIGDANGSGDGCNSGSGNGEESGSGPSGSGSGDGNVRGGCIVPSLGQPAKPNGWEMCSRLRPFASLVPLGTPDTMGPCASRPLMKSNADSRERRRVGGASALSTMSATVSIPGMGDTGDGEGSKSGVTSGKGVGENIGDGIGDANGEKSGGWKGNG